MDRFYSKLVFLTLSVTSTGLDKHISLLPNLGPYSQNFIFIVTYEWALLARVFVTGKPFHPSVM